MERDLCGSLPANALLAYAYVPMQKWDETYTPAKALVSGTLFPALDKPLGVYGRDFYKKCENEEATICDILS